MLLKALTINYLSLSFFDPVRLLNIFYMSHSELRGGSCLFIL